ncbi:hypothetical protein VPNG_00231 [Cytospora leucostoma]|uniref:Uncharacterized protein n=1 Tax=Cytospora leucostoma TaxID=1230097 RepID=A0A423XN42_9PEZI|nr:hypothetical protein VPNG_00231 [Cytospora leucostoma]
MSSATDDTAVNDRLDLVNSGLQLADNVLQILPWVIGLGIGLYNAYASRRAGYLKRVLGGTSLTEPIADPTPADGTWETKRAFDSAEILDLGGPLYQ